MSQTPLASQPCLTPESPAWVILADFLAGDLPLHDLCSRYQVAPTQLEAFLTEPSVRNALDSLERMARLRLPLLAAQAAPAAIGSLHRVASAPAPDDPRLAVRHAETARKSSTLILNIASPPKPRARRAATARPDALAMETPEPVDRPPNQAADPHAALGPDSPASSRSAVDEAPRTDPVDGTEPTPAPAVPALTLPPLAAEAQDAPPNEASSDTATPVETTPEPASPPAHHARPDAEHHPIPTSPRTSSSTRAHPPPAAPTASSRLPCAA